MTPPANSSNSNWQLPDDASLPNALGYRWPAEWEPHRATWLVWPHNPNTWPNRLTEARRQFATFVQAVARFERVVVVAVGEAFASAQLELGATAQDPNVAFHKIPTNDSWIRDYGPIGILGLDGQPAAQVDFDYNAWGRRYVPFDQDARASAAIADETGRVSFRVGKVLEGGAIDGNGDGLLLTTKSCVLNPNRNGDADPTDFARLMRGYLGVKHVIWLAGEIPGDDTDGHVDQIARFVGPDTVLLTDLPDSTMYRDNRHRIESWARQTNHKLNIVPLTAPQPRQVNKTWLPASYANFCFVNDGLLVPTFRDSADDRALRTLDDLLPNRSIVPVPSEQLVLGLGALHCLSLQEPDVLRTA